MFFLKKEEEKVKERRKPKENHKEKLYLGETIEQREEMTEAWKEVEWN